MKRTITETPHKSQQRKLYMCCFIYSLKKVKKINLLWIKTPPSHNYDAQFHFIDRQEKLLTFVAEVV